MSRKVIVHWTAGTLQPNSIDFEHYHYLVNGDGLVIQGKYSVADNDNCQDGKYAAHCGGGNTQAIGIAMCGMSGFISKNRVGKYPLTSKQVERTFKLIAEVCKQYNIPIDAEHVMTHYEFGRKHPKTSSSGKIDIIYLPSHPNILEDQVGNFIRSKATWYMGRI